MQKRKTRVLIAKVGLDGHDRGAKVIARRLRDAGMEVIYTGTRQSADQVASAAVQEDADVLGLSFLAGDQMVLVPRIMQALRDRGKGDIPVVVGGIILKRQAEELMKMGVKKIFFPGTPTAEIVSYLQKEIAPPF